MHSHQYLRATDHKITTRCQRVCKFLGLIDGYSLRVGAIFTLVLLFIGSTFAQNSTAPAGNALGSPSGSYLLSDIESINLYSGKVNTVVPIATISGRGQAGYTMVYPIKDAQWLTESEAQTNGISVLATDHPDNTVNPWRTVFLRPFEFGTLSFRYTVKELDCFDGANNPNCYRYAALVAVFTSADGTEHALFDEKRGGGSSNIVGVYPNQSWSPGLDRGLIFSAKDGSGWSLVADPETPQSTDYHVRTDVAFFANNQATNSREIAANGYLKNNNGTVIRFESGRAQWIRDRNGNKTTFVYEIGGQNDTKLDKVIDSNNRITDIVYGSGYEQVVYSGTGGQARTITISHSSLQSRLIAGNSIQYIAGLFPAYPQYGSPGTFDNRNSIYNPTVVSTITLPDNRSFAFYYNSYGEVARLESPAGAAVEYTYGAGLAGSPITSGASALYAPNSSFPNQLNTDAWIYRRLLERREYPNGSSTAALKTSFGTFEFDVYSSTGKVRKDQVDATSSLLLGREDHYFYGSPTQWLGACCGPPIGFSGMLDGREFKTEAVDTTNNTVLSRNESPTTLGCSGPRASCGSGGNPLPWSPFVGSSTQSIFQPSTGNYRVSKSDFSFDNYNNLTDTYQYDLGTNSPGSFVRRSHTDFVTASNYTSETSAHLRSLPSQTWISSDMSGYSKVSLSAFAYDGGSLTARSNPTGHDTANFGTGSNLRGNLTSATSYSNAASQSGAITTSSQYDILGNIVSTTDARGFTKTIGYDDNFGSPDNNATTPSTISQLNGLTTFALPSSSTYQITNQTPWTAYVQYEYFTGAVVNTQDINGVISKTFYNDVLDRPTQSVSAVGIFGMETQSSIVYDDGNHRVEKTSDLRTSGDNLLKTVSIYDGLGRTTETRSYESGSTYIASQTQYDPLGRAFKVSNPFRSGESVVWTTNKYDSLGRVYETETPDGAKVLTAFDAERTLVTDQAGKKRLSKVDGLGNMKEVWEITTSDTWTESLSFPGESFTTGYKTSYNYDLLNNLTTVSQGNQTRYYVYDSLSRVTSAQNPESGTQLYYYDNNGNVEVRVDNRGVYTHSEYDELNRVTRRWHNGSLSSSTHLSPALPAGVGVTFEAKYTYDQGSNSKGRLSTARTGSISHGSWAHRTSNEYDYDNLGRVSLFKQWIGKEDAYFDVGYDYYVSGVVKKITYPSGKTVTYTYDDSGRQIKLEGTIGDGTARTYVEGIQYNSLGAIKEEKLGTITPLYHKQQFNSRGQLEAVRLSTTQVPADGDRGEISNLFGSSTTNNGNLSQQNIYIPGSNFYQQTYTYDLLNRLTAVTEKQNGSGNDSFNQTFSYDRYGNRTINASATFNAPEPQFDINSTNRIFSPGENTGVACNDTSTSRLMCYDNAGNLIRDKHVTNAAWMVYDGEGKMSQHSSNDALTNNAYYLYDADGKRKQTSIDPYDSQNYIYGISGELLADATSTKVKKEYAYRNGQLLMSITNPGRNQTADLRWMITDHLGTSRIVVDKTGDLSAIKRHDYLPFGEEIGATVGGRSTGQGYGTPQADGVKQQFTGYERDLESGLDFAQARYMGSSLGRFTSPDPLASSASPASPASWNRYAYVGNSPLVRVDPTGMFDDYYNFQGQKIGETDGGTKIWFANVTRRDDNSVWIDMTSRVETTMAGVERARVSAVPLQPGTAGEILNPFADAIVNGFRNGQVGIRNGAVNTVTSTLNALNPVGVAIGLELPTLHAENAQQKAYELSVHVGVAVGSGLAAGSIRGGAEVQSLTAEFNLLYRAEAARDAAMIKYGRDHATYIGGYTDEGAVAFGRSSNPAGCAEDDIIRQLGPSAKFTQAFGWRGGMNKTLIDPCPNCLLKYSPTQLYGR